MVAGNRLKFPKFCDLLTRLSTARLRPLRNVVVHLELLNGASELRLCIGVSLGLRRRRVLKVPLYLLQAQRSSELRIG